MRSFLRYVMKICKILVFQRRSQLFVRLSCIEVILTIYGGIYPKGKLHCCKLQGFALSRNLVCNINKSELRMIIE